MFAIEESASIFWARLMRGTMSIATAVTSFAFSSSSSSAFWPG